MATITAKAAGGLWEATGTWEPEQVPTAADDVILASTSGSVTIKAASSCRSLEAANYTKTLKFEAELKIGTSTSNGGLAMKFGASMTRSGAAGEKLTFVSTSGTTEAITTAGKTLPPVIFEGSGGKWKLEDALTTAGENSIQLKAGELKTNGQTVTAWRASAVGTSVLELGASTVNLTAKSGTVWSIEATCTLTAGTSTIELTGSGAVSKSFSGGGKAYATVTVAAQNTEISAKNTFTTLNNNTAAKVATIKGTTVEKSKTLTMTEGTLPVAGEELKGTAIPTGTTVVKIISEGLKTIEMSAEATSTVGVAETIEVFQIGLLLKQGVTQTVLNYNTNGKATELVRLASNENGKAATISKASGRVAVDYQITRDSTAAGTTEWYAGAHSTNVSNNSVWKFETPVAALTLSAAATSGGSMTLTTTAPITAEATGQSTASMTVSTSAETPLATGTSSSTASMAITAEAIVGLSAAAAASTSGIEFTVATQPTPNPAAGRGTAKLGFTVPTQIPLEAIAGISEAGGTDLYPEEELFPENELYPGLQDLNITARTGVGLGTITAISGGELTVSTNGIVPLSASAASSTAAMTVTTTGSVALEPAVSQSTGSFGLSVETQIPLEPAIGVGGGSVFLNANVDTLPSAGKSSATIKVSATTIIALKVSAGLSHGIFSNTVPTRIPLGPATGFSEAGGPAPLPGEEMFPSEELYLGLGDLPIKVPTQLMLQASSATSSTLRLRIRVKRKPGHSNPSQHRSGFSNPYPLVGA